MDKRERIIRKKISHDGRGTKWGGYLTPVEIIYIVDVWKVQQDLNDWHVKYAREQIKKGESNPGWFYFVITKKDHERLKLGY